VEVNKLSVPSLYSDEWEYSRRIDIKASFKAGEVESDVRYIAEIGEKERFGPMNLCVRMTKLEGGTTLMWTSFSIRITESKEYKDWATAVQVAGNYRTEDLNVDKCGMRNDPCHPSFKHAWLSMDSWVSEVKAEFDVYGWIDVWKEKEVPPEEKPPEEKPPKPEKPEEPFDVGKWLEFALRNILRDSEPPSCTPHNTWLLVTLLTAIYINTLANIDWFVKTLGLVPITGVLLSEPWRILTYMWLHYPTTEVINSIVVPHAHIAFNVLFLWVFGDNVECRLGYGKYIAYYILCGVTAGLGQVLWLHIIGLGLEPIVIIGASGAISGILGMYLVFFPNNTVVFMNNEVKAYWFIASWFAGQVALMYSSEITIGVAAHVVGFITGVIVALVEKKMEAVAK
jgi:membrane associated rhomboid family serine protease